MVSSESRQSNSRSQRDLKQRPDERRVESRDPRRADPRRAESRDPRRADPRNADPRFEQRRQDPRHKIQDDYSFDEIQQQSKDVRNESLQTTRDMIARMTETENTASSTMNRLHNQSQILKRADRDIDVAAANEKYAAVQVNELGRLKTWFAFKNPFKSKNIKDAEKAKLEAQLASQDFQNSMKARENSENDNAERKREAMDRRNQRERDYANMRRKHGAASSTREYNDLMDDEDRAAEDEIDRNLDGIQNIMGNLKAMALTMSSEVEEQGHLIDTVGAKADDLKANIQRTGNRLKKH